MVGALFAYLNWTAHQERAAKRRSHAMGIIAPGAVNSVPVPRVNSSNNNNNNNNDGSSGGGGLLGDQFEPPHHHTSY
jgi:hypothetical protein